MNKTNPIPWSTEDHLETPKDIAAYLEVVLKDGDPELLAHALGVVARAKAKSEKA
jgi:probable addiction module antidote protein